MRNCETAFMVPVAEYFTADEAREFAAEQWDEETVAAGAGWYSRLSAPGYLDCTDWQGPYVNAFRAIRAVCDFYEVDVRGNPLT